MMKTCSQLYFKSKNLRKSYNFTVVTVNRMTIAINLGKDIWLLALKQMIKVCASHIPGTEYV